MMWVDWRLVGASCLAAAAMVQQGCSSVPPAAAALSEVQTGLIQVRLANLSPNSPSLGLQIGSDTAPSWVPFGTVGDYVSLSADQYDVALTVAMGQRDVVLDSEWTDLSSSPSFTVLALDEMPGVRVAVLSESPRPNSGEALVRLVNAVPDSVALDWLADGDQVLARNTVFGDIVEYQSMRPGFLSLSLQPAGTQRTERFEVDIRSGQSYTFYATGLQRDQRGLALVQSEDGTLLPQL